MKLEGQKNSAKYYNQIEINCNLMELWIKYQIDIFENVCKSDNRNNLILLIDTLFIRLNLTKYDSENSKLSSYFFHAKSHIFKHKADNYLLYRLLNMYSILNTNSIAERNFFSCFFEQTLMNTKLRLYRRRSRKDGNYRLRCKKLFILFPYVLGFVFKNNSLLNNIRFDFLIEFFPNFFFKTRDFFYIYQQRKWKNICLEFCVHRSQFKEGF